MKNDNQLSIPEKRIKIITNHSNLCRSEQNPPKRSNSRGELIRLHDLQESSAFALSGALPSRFGATIGGPRMRGCLVRSEPPAMIMPNT
jgi:hypothetical protein